jgi:hypothetical protein
MHRGGCRAPVCLMGTRAWQRFRAPPVPLVLASVLLVVPIGCGRGDGLDRRPISGVVTLDGRPLPRGAILFEPDPRERVGTAVGATIRRGAFAIPGREGPEPGTYRVRIYASSAIQAPAGPGRSERAPRPMVEMLPGRYNRQTRLNVDVTPHGSNTFRFELKSTPDSPGA